MKGFFSLFTRSAAELKQVRTLTTAGMLMAVAIALRSFSIDITQDIRISFSFIPIIAIAVLFGPVVSGIANISTDFLGYIISNHSAREYSIPLALVTLLAGTVYGIICYRDDIKMTPKRITSICIARAAVVLICNLCLNSLIIYTSYVNRDFSIFNPEMYNAFGMWMLPRITKNGGQLIVDVILISTLIPLIINAYSQVKTMYAGKKKNSPAK